MNWDHETLDRPDRRRRETPATPPVQQQCGAKNLDDDVTQALATLTGHLHRLAIARRDQQQLAADRQKKSTPAALRLVRKRSA